MIMPILAVSDLEKSLSFYTEKLGFEKMISFPGPDGSLVFAFVGLGPAVNIGLQLSPTPEGTRGDGAVFMIYLPDGQEIDPYYEQVKAKGVAIETEIADQYWGDRTFSVKDPDGFYLTLAKSVKQVPIDEIEKVISGPSPVV